MSQVIHCREVNGKKRYRLWSTITDAYLTAPLTERQLGAWLRGAAVEMAIAEHERMFPSRIASANTWGSSGRFDERVALSTPWKEER